MNQASTVSHAPPAKVLGHTPTVLVFDQPRENIWKTENIKNLETLAQQAGSISNPLFESLLEEGELGNLNRSYELAASNEEDFEALSLLFGVLSVLVLGFSLISLLLSPLPWGFWATGVVSIPFCLVFNKQRKKSLKKAHRAKKLLERFHKFKKLTPAKIDTYKKQIAELSHHSHCPAHLQKVLASLYLSLPSSQHPQMFWDEVSDCLKKVLMDLEDMRMMSHAT